MDYQGLPPKTSAITNGVWGVPIGNYSLRTSHYSLISRRSSFKEAREIGGGEAGTSCPFEDRIGEGFLARL